MRQDLATCGAPGGLSTLCPAKEDFLATLRSTPLAELHTRLASLTPQERTILEHIVRGQCNKDICRALGIEITTAKVHASRIFKKLHVKNRVQAAVLQLWTLLLSGEAVAGYGRDAIPAKARAPARPARIKERPDVLQCETT